MKTHVINQILKTILDRYVVIERFYLLLLSTLTTLATICTDAQWLACI